MVKINGCIKCIFIFFNVLFMILGCVLIYLAARTTALTVQAPSFEITGLGWGWVFAIGVLSVSSLGIYAACSEKALALKIFAGFMGFGMIIMMIFGIVVAVKRNQVKTAFYSASSELAEPYMKDQSFRRMLEFYQQYVKCCGIVSANDWGEKIPYSCECSSLHRAFFSCKTRPQGTRGPPNVFEESCGVPMFSDVDVVFKVLLGFFFGFSLTALLGLLITIFMIHEVQLNDTGGGIAMKGY